MANKKMSNVLKYVICFALMLVLIAVTFYVIFKNNDISEIWQALVECPHKIYLPVACIVVIGYLVFYAVFAMVPLKARGGETSFGKCFVYACADFFYAAITPSAAGGEPMVIYTMNHDGVPLSRSSLAIVIQAMYNRAALLVYGILGFAISGGVIFGLSSAFNWLIALGLFINLCIVGFCFSAMRFPAFIKKAGAWLINLLAKMHIVKDRQKALAGFEKQMDEYKASASFLSASPKLGVKMFLACFAQRGCMFFASYLVYCCFGLNALCFAQVMCIQAVVCIVVDNIPLPGAMGANEWATGAIYGLMYRSSSEATAAMLLNRILTFYFPLVISGIVSVVKYFRMLLMKKHA